MKNLILVALIGLISQRAFSQDNKSVGEKLDQYYTALSSIQKFNGNVLIRKGDTVLLDRNYNMPAYTDSLHVDRMSKFIIASVSKVYTKFFILILVKEGRLKLDDKLSRFIPDFPNGKKITIQQLMTHQSGLPRELAEVEKYPHLSLDEVVRLAKKEKLEFEPGSGTLYSNIGFNLLHYIIGKAAPGGYKVFTTKWLKKMGLHNTGEYNLSAGQIPHFVWGFDQAGDRIVAVDKNYIDRIETGNYYSTIDDMDKFSSELLSGRTVPKNLALKLFSQDSVLIQAGGRPGYRAYFYKNLKNGVSFIFLSNFSGVPIQEMTADVVSIVEGRPYNLPEQIQRKEIQLPDSILKRYVGTYVLAADNKQSLRFELQSGQLFVIDGSGGKDRLKADSETTFFQDPASKDGYIFRWNEKTKDYELTLVSTGISLKTIKQ